MENTIKKRVLVTGGAGFIGSALVRYLIKHTPCEVIVFDKLTYAGNMESLEEVSSDPRFFFHQGDICDKKSVRHVFGFFKPDSVMHLAAESHVDRSIDAPSDFINTNIIGTYNMLEGGRNYFAGLDDNRRKNFMFHHISTDEVYGDLEDTGDLFTEETPYSPSSPYSASKAASDHLVRAWCRTFKLPTVITNCSNNYGPYHFPEKLIPLTILNALSGKPLTVYGKGEQIRDWLFVDDHVKALWTVVSQGISGETYNIGGNEERKNIEVVNTVCNILDELKPRADGKSYNTQITFVSDRPGHDMRYAIDASKIKNELSWQPQETFNSGIRKTVEWYLANVDGWCKRVLDGSYKLERLGLGGE